MVLLLPPCDVFLTLAQAPAGLSCFLIEGADPGFQVQRLKDKLGTRSLPSSEVEFRGVTGRLVGEEGRGVQTIIRMVNHTRLDCLIGSAAGMRVGTVQAIHHARHRSSTPRNTVRAARAADSGTRRPRFRRPPRRRARWRGRAAAAPAGHLGQADVARRLTEVGEGRADAGGRDAQRPQVLPQGVERQGRVRGVQHGHTGHAIALQAPGRADAAHPQALLDAGQAVAPLFGSGGHHDGEGPVLGQVEVVGRHRRGRTVGTGTVEQGGQQLGPLALGSTETRSISVSS